MPSRARLRRAGLPASLIAGVALLAWMGPAAAGRVAAPAQAHRAVFAAADPMVAPSTIAAAADPTTPRIRPTIGSARAGLAGLLGFVLLSWVASVPSWGGPALRRVLHQRGRRAPPVLSS